MCNDESIARLFPSITHKMSYIHPVAGSETGDRHPDGNPEKMAAAFTKL